MRKQKIDFIEQLYYDQNTTDFLYNILNRAKKCDKLAYQFLGRLKTDLNYSLGCGNRSSGCLWFYNEPEKHLYFMWFLWACFPADSKPEWLTFGDLMKYEMLLKYKKE